MACLWGHKWDGCQCTKCGKVRSEEHDWDLCKGACRKCGSKQAEQHDWEGCKCKRCGKTRDAEHDWAGCKCKRCGKTQDIDHGWAGCTCIRCGRRRDVEHNIAEVPDKCAKRCVRCGKEVPFHKNEDFDGNCICKKCGIEEHNFKQVYMEKKSSLSSLPDEKWICSRCGTVKEGWIDWNNVGRGCAEGAEGKCKKCGACSLPTYYIIYPDKRKFRIKNDGSKAPIK